MRVNLLTRLFTCLVDASPVAVSSAGPPPSSLLTRQLQESWRNLRALRGESPIPSGRRLTDSLMFEVTDASVVQDGSSKYVVSSDKQRRSGGHLTQSGAGHVADGAFHRSTSSLLKDYFLLFSFSSEVCCYFMLHALHRYLQQLLEGLKADNISVILNICVSGLVSVLHNHKMRVP